MEYIIVCREIARMKELAPVEAVMIGNTEAEKSVREMGTSRYLTIY